MNAGEFAKRRARIEHEAWRRSPGFINRALAALVRESEAELVIVDGKHVAWRMTNGKTICKKRRYRSEPEVLEVLAGMIHAQQRQKTPARSYLCPHCDGWHLTSQTKHHH